MPTRPAVSARAARTADLQALLGSGRVQRGAAGISRVRARGNTWGLDRFYGHLVEVSGQGPTATLTAATDLVRAAQHTGELVVWLPAPGTNFFPPDLAANGVDFEALVVIQVDGCEETPSSPPPARHGARSAPRSQKRSRRSVRETKTALQIHAAERLLRAGVFALVIVDFWGASELPLAIQSRLAGLARHHHTALVWLTQKPAHAPSLGLASLRYEARRERGSTGDLALTLHALRNRRGQTALPHQEPCHGPPGLR